MSQEKPMRWRAKKTMMPLETLQDNCIVLSFVDVSVPLDHPPPLVFSILYFLPICFTCLIL